MRRGRFFVLLLATVLTGCLTDPDPAAPPSPGAIHVFVVGGAVTESGPDPEPQGVCDVARPPFSVDDDQERIWYVPSKWHDADPRGAEVAVAVVRVDETHWLWDSDCWTPQFQTLDAIGSLVWWHSDVPQSISVVIGKDGPRVAGAFMKPGDVYDWIIDVSCECTQNGVEGSYHYDGVLHVQYLGAWSRDRIVITDYEHLPPLDVPYWDGY